MAAKRTSVPGSRRTASDTVATALLEWAPDAVLGVDEDGRVALANARAEQLLGVTRDHLLGVSAETLVPERVREVIEARAKAYLKDPHPLEIEAAAVLRPDGGEVPVEVALSAIPTDKGRMVTAILRDVSGRQRIEEELRRSQRQLEEAQQLARMGSWEWDLSTNVVTWSDELWRIYGIERDTMELSYENFLSKVHPDDRESVDARNHKCFADHQPFEDVKRVVRPDGSYFLMRTQGEMVCAPDGTPLRMLGVCEDVTAEVRAEQAQAMLASIVRSSDDAIVAFTSEGRITSWNPAAERLYGWTGPEMEGRQVARLVPESRAAEETKTLQRLLAGERIDHYETQHARRDGTIIDVSLSLSPVRDVHGGITGVSAIARDITERKRFEAQLRYLADRDGLTGLFNRRRFAEALDHQLAQAARYSSVGAVLLLDLDNFKYANDTFGHKAGDELLQGVASLLRARLRETDVLARLGGDEFAVLLPRADAAEARAVADGLVAALRRHVGLVAGGQVRVTASVGVALFSADRLTVDELLAAADRAMYAAKDAGRDRAVLHTADMRRPVAAGTRRSWEHRIREALETDGFTLAWQPIVPLDGERCTRYELLLRMRPEDGGEDILPGAFLGVAERLGLMGAIDRWVVKHAIAQVAEHQRLEPDLVVEVNLSGRSVGDHELPALIANDLELAGVSPERLVLEITETAAIANMDEARRFAEQLTALGCRFALDDFGAGFGSFSYLKHLPAAYLKIDGDFVRSPRSRTDELVVEAIVGVARGLGKETIAEWVGDEETVELLREYGVDFAQGFHTGAPIPEAEVAARLAASLTAPAAEQRRARRSA